MAFMHALGVSSAFTLVEDQGYILSLLLLFHFLQLFGTYSMFSIHIC